VATRYYFDKGNADYKPSTAKLKLFPLYKREKDKLRFGQKRSPCRNRGRLPKLTAYEKIYYSCYAGIEPKKVPEI